VKIYWYPSFAGASGGRFNGRGKRTYATAQVFDFGPLV